MAIAAMGACRRDGFVMRRAEEKIVPADIPLPKWRLKKLAPGKKKSETPTATWMSWSPSARPQSDWLCVTCYRGSDRVGMAAARRAICSALLK